MRGILALLALVLLGCTALDVGPTTVEAGESVPTTVKNLPVTITVVSPHRRGNCGITVDIFADASREMVVARFFSEFSNGAQFLLVRDTMGNASGGQDIVLVCWDEAITYYPPEYLKRTGGLSR